MAWVQIIDTDANGTTPQPYTDLDGHSTSMTVVSTNEVNYGGAALQNRWFIGDNNATAAETHTHSFSTPVHVLRIDLDYLDNGELANFAYKDTNGNLSAINLNEWVADGDAVVALGTGHSIQNLNASVNGVRGSNATLGAPGGTTTIEFYFPAPTTQFYVGRNSISGQSLRDFYGYKLFYDDHRSVVCFTKGTMIETKSGLVAIEELHAGDLVRTRDNGFQSIRWIGSRKLRGHELTQHHNLRPICIKAEALGVNTPSRDLIVSPQHRVLLRSALAYEQFGTNEILIAAKHLLKLSSVHVVEDMPEVDYFHILFKRHEIIFANGAEAESLYLGSETLKSLSIAARKEIFAIFPEIEAHTSTEKRISARPFASGRLRHEIVEQLSQPAI